MVLCHHHHHHHHHTNIKPLPSSSSPPSMCRLAVFCWNWYIHAILQHTFIANTFKRAQAFPFLYRLKSYGGESKKERVRKQVSEWASRWVYFLVGFLIKDTKQLIWFMSPWIHANVQWIVNIYCGLKKRWKESKKEEEKKYTRTSRNHLSQLTLRHTRTRTHTQSYICTIDWTYTKNDPFMNCEWYVFVWMYARDK